MSSGPFPHHMANEIFAQPQAVRDTLAACVRDGELCFDLGVTIEQLRNLQQVTIVGSGSSRHAGLAGRLMLKSLAQLPSSVEIASEYQFDAGPARPGELAIAISQSGETTDTRAALARAKSLGIPTVAICNVAESSLMREAGAALHTKAGPELSVPSTKAFTSQWVVLFLLAAYLGKLRGTLGDAPLAACLAEAAMLPDKIQSVLELNPRCESLARQYRDAERFFFLARGIHFPAALDAALKLKEAAYANAQGYPAGEFRHGPMALLDARACAFVLALHDANSPPSDLRDKTLADMAECKRRSARVIALAPRDLALDGIAHDVLRLPSAAEFLAPVLEIVPLQLLAYHLGVLRGCDVDHPRHLTKALLDH